MLELTVEPIAYFNQETQEFSTRGPSKPVRLKLEHSLIALSKWEEQTRRKFFSRKEGPQTKDDWRFYISCMSIDKPVTQEVLSYITDEQIDEVTRYVQENRTASTLAKQHSKRNGQNEILTSELIYYYLAQFNLVETGAPKWHLSRCLMIIGIANAKQSTGKGMSKKSIYDQNAKLNAARRKAMHSKG